MKKRQEVYPDGGGIAAAVFILIGLLAFFFALMHFFAGSPKGIWPPVGWVAFGCVMIWLAKKLLPSRRINK